MPIALDASSPVRFDGLGTPAFSATSASFTAPANSLITICANFNDNDGAVISSAVIDSGGLTWTLQVKRASNEATAGAESSIWTAPQVTSAARTVTLEWNGTATGTPRRLTGKVDVWTGVDLAGPVDTVGANNEGGSGTNNFTTASLTPTANGVLLVNDSEWFALGTFEASSDLTENTATWVAEFSVDRGYKACVSGVGVTANLNAAGASGAQHKWCQIILRAAAAGAAVLTGTAVAGGVTEAQITAGGETIILTLTGDTWIPS